MPKKKAEGESVAQESKVLRNVWLVGLGAMAATEEGTVKLYRYLREKGEAFEADHKDDIDGVKEKAVEVTRDAKSRAEKGWHQLSEKFDGRFSSAFSRAGVSEKELGTLKERVETLSQKIDELKPELAN